MDSFVYRWRNTKTRQWYIGYHKGSEHDGYICSSKTAKPAIESNPDVWQRKILRWGTKQQMVVLERKLLNKLNAKRNPQSYNRSNGNAAWGGRTKGSKSKTTYHIDLNNLTADQVATLYAQHLADADWHNVRLMDMWLIKRLVVKRSKKRI